MNSDHILGLVDQNDLQTDHQNISWIGSFKEYIDMAIENPNISRTAFQRLYDMIASHGHLTYTDSKKKITKWKFFDDPIDNGKDAIFGLDIPLMKLVNIIKAGALKYGAEKRVILLHGPVGAAKSTIVRLLKKGLELYSKQKEGALYTYQWTNLTEILDMENTMACPINEDPFHLIPIEKRKIILEDINKGKEPNKTIYSEGELCPVCRFIFKKLLDHYNGDWKKILEEHTQVKRVVLSEKDRIGIGTFQPKDEKNQDSTELTGDINYRKIAIYGSDSDPRAFNFDGEFNIANRGLIEFVEMLKLDVAFLYDLLTASQEHKIKPKKYAQTDIDQVIIGHTNEPEYRKLQSNEFMEALKDRTIKIDIPYITTQKNEVKIYEKDYNNKTVKNIHLAPHTLSMAAAWAVLTRLEEPKKANISLIQKMKLYNGKISQEFTEDSVKELRKETENEGLQGISPRYIQDKISSTLILDKGNGCVNPFILLNEIESGLKTHSLINNNEIKSKYIRHLHEIKKEYEDIVKHEVQQALSSDKQAIEKLCGNYIDNVKAYIQKEKIRNNYTGIDDLPNERLMRSIEERIDIPENRKDDFRREIMNYIGALALDGKTFDFRTNERLHKALEIKLFEDQKDTIKLTTLISKVVDTDTQTKINTIKTRLRKNHNYCEICANDALSFVASAFSRGNNSDNN